jgi:hypothetical protein
VAQLDLVLGLLIINRLDDHALLVPDGCAAGEHLQPTGVLRVSIEVLALNALGRDAAARARRGRRARLGR